MGRHDRWDPRARRPAGGHRGAAGRLYRAGGTAIANAEAQAALTASRARIVAAADAARRRIERDLHDGAQQRLVTLALQLRAAAGRRRHPRPASWQQLDGVASGLDGRAGRTARDRPRHPPGRPTEGGLRPALRTLARRSPVPVNLDVQVTGRLPDQVEIAAYYVVAEALTNTAKHAGASTATVEVAARPRTCLHVCVRDDGRGGADFGRGSGLVGLKDRVEALGGRIRWTARPAGAPPSRFTSRCGESLLA